MYVFEAAKILDISINAEPKTIKEAYKRLSLLYHPDRNINKSPSERIEAEHKFKQVAQAYEIMSSPIKNNKVSFNPLMDPFNLFDRIFNPYNSMFGYPPGLADDFILPIHDLDNSSSNFDYTSFQKSTIIRNGKKFTHTKHIVNGEVVKDETTEDKVQDYLQ